MARRLAWSVSVGPTLDPQGTDSFLGRVPPGSSGKDSVFVCRISDSSGGKPFGTATAFEGAPLAATEPIFYQICLTTSFCRDSKKSRVPEPFRALPLITNPWKSSSKLNALHNWRGHPLTSFERHPIPASPASGAWRKSSRSGKSRKRSKYDDSSSGSRPTAFQKSL